MASVYILYSNALDKYYIGSCLDIDERLNSHNSKEFKDSFTARANDWCLFFLIENLAYKQARLIEKHIKQMKSRKYIENIKRYPAILEKLRNLY